MTPKPAASVSLSVTSTTGDRPQPAADEDELVAGPQDSGLLIDYSVTNSNASPVLVNDRIYTGSSSAGRDDEGIDVLKAFVVAGPDGVVDVVKRTFLPKPAPEGPDFTVFYQATVVPAGGTVKGRAFVPLPFTHDVPGFAAPSDADVPLPATPTRWRFCLGVTPSVYEPDLLPDKSHSLVANTRYAPDREQRMVCSEPVSTPARG